MSIKGEIVNEVLEGICRMVWVSVVGCVESMCIELVNVI